MASLHRQTFVDLVNVRGWTVGAELGVDKAILTGMLLRECPKLARLIAVDLFPDRQRSRRAFELAHGYAGRLELHDSVSTYVAADAVDDGSLDFVFIDADHSEKAVWGDIARWAPKVRPGGWVGGHDYDPRKFPGVVKAVDRVYGSRVQMWPGTIWGVWA